MPKSKKKPYPKKNKSNSLVIAIDGPAGAGKSTVAKEVARKLNFTYLDTGAMYRAITLKALKNKLNLKDQDCLVDLAKKTKIVIKPTKDYSLKVFLDDQDVTTEIRKPEITQNVSYIAKVAGLRKIMVKLQRAFSANNNIVVDGRDTTTVVFPGAPNKFYLDADFKERIKRRSKDFRDLRQRFGTQEVKHDLESRDKADMTRKAGPLKKAKDAIFIDSTHMSVREVADKIIRIVKDNG